MEKISGFVTEVHGNSSGEGYIKFKLDAKNIGIVRAEAERNGIEEGAYVYLEGDWIEDPRHGEIFVADICEPILPDDPDDLKIYLGSDRIEGIDEELSGKIVDKFGSEVFKVLSDTPARLIEVEGVCVERLKIIKESLKRHILDMVLCFLVWMGVSVRFGRRICARYADHSISVLKEKPYRMVGEIEGFEFRHADRIAMMLGFEADCYERIRCCLKYILTEDGKDGHCYEQRSRLIQRAVKMLRIEENAVRRVYERMIKNGELFRECRYRKNGRYTDAIYLRYVYEREKYVAKKLYSLIEATANDKLYRSLTRITEEKGRLPRLNEELIKELCGVDFCDEQLEAILNGALNKIIGLTGGPGVGKTSVLKALICIAERYNLSFWMLAPTGKAAKRMNETTGKEACTIHRCLHYRPGYQPELGEFNPLSGDLVIMDESSMVNLDLLYYLLKALPDTIRLLIVGDEDQLPAIGSGNILADILKSGAIPVMRLSQVHRQDNANGHIIPFAKAIHNGEMYEFPVDTDSDLVFIEENDDDMIRQTLLNQVTEVLPAEYGVSAEEIQTITPMKIRSLGIEKLNRQIQSSLGFNNLPGIRYRKYVYHFGDRVMQLENDYKKGVFNGDVGYVESIDCAERKVYVCFGGRRIEYTYVELETLALAYAFTIHKSQGGEYPIVVIPLTMDHKRMLNRNLLYTAVTRAKTKLVLIGSREALEYAIRNTPEERRTLLAERLSSM